VVFSPRALSSLASLIDELDKYERNPGIIGKIHGDKKEPKPAIAESNRVVSKTIII
jgi:hypothetical protein